MMTMLSVPISLMARVLIPGLKSGFGNVKLVGDDFGTLKLF
jgi:hypothetical protein